MLHISAVVLAGGYLLLVRDPGGRLVRLGQEAEQLSALLQAEPARLQERHQLGVPLLQLSLTRLHLLRVEVRPVRQTLAQLRQLGDHLSWRAEE